MNIRSHPLFATLRDLKGNPRACVYTEPLWGIPYNLYIPYASLYMLALGLDDAKIGLLASIGMAFQVIFAMLSGAITDKFGRKRTTFFADLLCWSVPCLLWAVSQNFYFFLVAAVFNSLWRISANSWTCLLVEDAEPDQMVNIYAWIYISGLLAAFFSPLAGLLVGRFSLVPTVRALYLFSFVMMTAKFVVMNHFVTETRQGQIRLAETHTQPLRSLLGGYRDVFAQLLRTPRTLVTLGIMLVMSITALLSGTFWSILVTERLGIPAQVIVLFPFAKSAMMLAFFFFVLPRIGTKRFLAPMVFGFVCYLAGQLLLIGIPTALPLAWVITALTGAALLEACAAALVGPFVDSLVAATIDPAERARIQAILYVIVILLTSPFGWIGGQLSSVNRILPFVLNLALFAAGGVLAVLAARLAKAAPEAGAA
ncbi:MAG: MFS transporter [Chloroflexota bacterium]